MSLGIFGDALSAEHTAAQVSGKVVAARDISMGEEGRVFPLFSTAAGAFRDPIKMDLLHHLISTTSHVQVMLTTPWKPRWRRGNQ